MPRQGLLCESFLLLFVGSSVNSIMTVLFAISETPFLSHAKGIKYINIDFAGGWRRPPMIYYAPFCRYLCGCFKMVAGVSDQPFTFAVLMAAAEIEQEVNVFLRKMLLDFHGQFAEELSFFPFLFDDLERPDFPSAFGIFTRL